MSDFKIVCGINPKDETIINLDKVKEIVLDDDYIENSMCVTIYGTGGDTWHFETDLTTPKQALMCFHSKGNKILFSVNGLNNNLRLLEENGYELGDMVLLEMELERVGGMFIPIRGGSL